MRARLVRPRHDRGAAAVEFGLIFTFVIAPLLCGILDYGLLFNDSISARNGVREAARQGVVSNFGASNDLTSLKESAKSQIGAITGPASVKVSAPDGWVKGKRLIICAVIPNPGFTKIVPMPSRITSKVVMSIETQAKPPTGPMTVADTGDFSWC